MELQYAQISRLPVLRAERPVYLLFGREQVLIEDVLGRLLAGVRQDADADPDVQTLHGHGTSCEQIAGELANLSLLGAGKVVVLRDSQRMRAPEQAKLAALLPKLGPGSLLVMLAGEPTYDSRTKKRKLLSEKLEESVRAVGVTIEFPSFREQDAERWVLASAKDAGVKVDPQAASRMVQLAGVDLMRLRNELEKVIGYAGRAGMVTVEDVELVVSRSPEATVFELIDAIGAQRPDRALASLKVLLDAGEPEQRILALIARQIRLLWQTKYLVENGYLKRSGPQVPPEVVRDTLPRDNTLSIMPQVQRPFLRDKLMAQAAALGWPALRRGLERVLAADLAFKGIEGEVDDSRLVLEMLVLELASGRKRR